MSQLMAERLKRASLKFTTGDKVSFETGNSGSRLTGTILRIMDAGYLVVLPIGSQYSKDTKPLVVNPKKAYKKKIKTFASPDGSQVVPAAE